jgi:hypothetical protein
MAVHRTLPKQTAMNRRAPLPPAEAKVPPAEIGAPEAAAAFQPGLFLSKLATGKTSREYHGNEHIFSQGDQADAVLYIQCGKVKLTVVSKRGKEAVVAILAEQSFFGEGCLVGQPLRISQPAR